MKKGLSIAEFSRQVVEIMPLMVREFAKREDNELTRGKISCPQMVALDYVVHHRRVKMTDIANTLSTKTSSASALVDRLIREKMLKRSHDEEDRRVVWITVTSKGRKVVHQVFSQKRRSIGFIFGGLSAKERGQYLSVLLKVKKQLLAASMAAVLVIFATQPAEAFFWQKKTKADVKKTAVVRADKPVSGPLTLQEAYRLTLSRSESLAIEKEDIAQAQARFYRSFRYFFPDVHFVKTRMERDVDDDASSDGTGVNGDFRRRVTPESRFTFSQPLFSGFREFAALAGAGADRKTHVYDYERAKELLFIDVMEAYYAVRQADKDVETLSSIRDLLSSRSKELKERTDLGRSRESELVTATSDWKLVEADLIAAQAAARTSRNLLEFYMGADLDGRMLVDDDIPTDPLPPSDAADKARTRLDVQSLEQAYRLRIKGVTHAQAGLFPAVSLDGNLYTERVGFQEGNDWDVLLTIDVPIFDAGETLGNIKDAASVRESARLAWERAKRSAELDILNEYENFRSALSSERALSDADAASKKNYEILTGEYRLSLVNNLDVLDALRRYQDTIRSYNRARYDARRAYWRYQVARGEAL